MAKVELEIVGDASKLEKELKRSSRSVDVFANKVNGTLGTGSRLDRGLTKSRAAFAGVAGALAVVGGSAVTRQISAAIENASNLNEEIAKSQQIFGDASKEVQGWAKTTTKAFGIARVEALGASASVGNMLTALGLNEKRAAAMSMRMVELAGDMAAFNNEDPSAMLERIRAGLSGEMEPLRRFGSILNETRVKQFAWASGLVDTGRKLTEQEKVLARYGLLLQDTAKQHGQAARESRGHAGQSRQLRANLKDLSTNIGQVLIPTLTDATIVANSLFSALDQMRGVDFTPGFDFPEPPSWLRTVSKSAALPGLAPVFGLSALVDQFMKADEQAAKATDPLRSERGNEAMDNLRIAAANRENAARQAARDLERSRKRFAEHMKGLGLKLDIAALEGGDAVAVLREMERAIERRIGREGRTFDLVEQLVQVRQQIADVVGQRVAANAERSRRAFEDIIDSLDLRLTRAQGTARFDDDSKVLAQIEQAILKRIAAEGKTLELERRLFDIRQQQADARRQASKARQFEALGLTAEGQERTPGAAALKKRLGTLQEQLAGTVLDTPKTQKQLDRIRNVLRGSFGKLGRDVRQAILQMFNDLTSALNSGSEADLNVSGEITRGGIRPLQRLIAGLTLTEEQIAQLERNMQRRRQGRPVNAFGVDFDGRSMGLAGAAGFGGGLGQALIINGSVNITANNTQEFIRELQKTGKRRTNRRGGAHAGRGAVL